MLSKTTIFALTALLLGVAGAQAETVTDPETPILQAILMQRSGETPNFDTIARASTPFLEADAFDKKKVLEEQIAQAKADFEAAAKIDTIRFSIDTVIEEFDFEAEGFPVRLFEPASFITTFPRITFANARDFRYFKAEGDVAREIAGKLDAEFSSARAHFVLTDLRPSPTDENYLQGRVVEVEYTTREGVKLGTMKAEEEPVLPADQLHALQDDILAHFKLPAIGIDLDAARKIISENYPAIAIRPAKERGEFQRKEDYDYAANSKENDVLVIAFGHDEKQVKTSIKNIYGAPALRFGPDMKCAEDVEADICGQVHLTNFGGRFYVTDLAFAQEFTAATHTDKVRESFGDKLDSLKETRTETSLYDHEFISMHPGKAAPALVYTGGEILPYGHPVFDVFHASLDKMTAPLMITAAQEKTGRAVLVTTMYRPYDLIKAAAEEAAKVEAEAKAAASVQTGTGTPIEPLKNQITTYCGVGGYCSYLKQASAMELPMPEGLAEGRLIEGHFYHAETDENVVSDNDWSDSTMTVWFFCSPTHPAISYNSEKWEVIDLHADSGFLRQFFYLQACHGDMELPAGNYDKIVADFGYASKFDDAGEYESFKDLMAKI